jgi:hypothetical protein
MPNAIARLPVEDLRLLEALLAGRMSATRWLSLILRQFVAEGRLPAAVKRDSSRAFARIVGHVPPRTWGDLERIRSRSLRAGQRARSSAEFLYWIAKEALDRRVVPADTIGTPDLSLRRKTGLGAKAAEARKEAERRRHREKERLRAERAAAKAETQILRHDDGAVREHCNVRVRPVVVAKFRQACGRRPRVSQSVALEEAMLDWVEKRSRAPRAAEALAAPEFKSAPAASAAVTADAALAPMEAGTKVIVRGGQIPDDLADGICHKPPHEILEILQHRGFAVVEAGPGHVEVAPIPPPTTGPRFADADPIEGPASA